MSIGDLPLAAVVCASELVLRTPGELAAAKARANPRMNEIEATLAKLPQVECPVIHRLTPGLYSREVRMFENMMVTSKIHKTEHQFVILSGDVSVWTEHEGVTRLKTGDVGITQAGTRRLLYMHKETRWVTFHPTTKTDLAEIEAELIFPHDPRADTAHEYEARLAGEIKFLEALK